MVDDEMYMVGRLQVNAYPGLSDTIQFIDRVAVDKDRVCIGILEEDAIAISNGDDAMARRVCSVLNQPLEAPDGWFLYEAKHLHTGIVFSGDKHEPLPHAVGSWYVAFQRFEGGRLTNACGQSLHEAWFNAVQHVKAQE